MSSTRYIMAAAHEAFPPDELLQQAAAAERAGFDAVCCSDHFQPWWEPGESGQAWAWLGAAGALTVACGLGTAVTSPVHRYHPALVAQFIATMGIMFPGRAFLGVGSGEALNEVPLGMDWPDTEEQLELLEEAVDIIVRLLEGETLDSDGHFPMRGARLHSRPARRPPVYVSAFHPGAARVAGRLGDGLWTLGDPETAPALIEVYRDACADNERPEGEVLLHATFAWSPDEATAFVDADRWRATLVPEYFTEDWHEPQLMQGHAQRTVPDRAVRSAFIIGPDPARHIARIREIEQLGATAVVLMNVSASDPLGAIETYGRHVLPQLRAGVT